MAALIVVDVQEDFCPPDGSLAVPDGRAVVPVANRLLRLPFALKVATKDWHPPGHVSFAASHAGAAPFASTATLANPANPRETYESRLWPVHCVQGTPGAALLPDLDVARLHRVVEKGQHPAVEMYSAFYAPLRDPRVCDSGLAAALRAAAVVDVFVVGLAADYCVRSTAVDAAAEGFRTYIVEEGTRAVDDGEWAAWKLKLGGLGVSVVSVEGDEVRRVAESGGAT